MSSETDTITTVQGLLQALDIGSAVAEHDEELVRYFVETATFRQLVQDKGDIIAGDKGTGKTALYQILRERYTTLDELADVEVISAFNPAGAPIFQRILENDGLTELQYLGVWKAYFFSLGGNWLLGLYDHEVEWTPSMHRLDEVLKATDLRSNDDSANTVFSQLANLVKRLFRPKYVEGGFSINEVGMPVVTGKIEFAEMAGPDGNQHQVVRHDEALGLLNRCLGEADIKGWLILDRLDEAFQARPEHEVPALRALLRAYLDLQDLGHSRLKLFLRRDLFARVIQGGFVNLTHINARKIEIVWEIDDLFDLLVRRIKGSTRVIEALGLEKATDDEIFAAVFPMKVDQGEKKSVTWRWMMERIRDSNGVRPPRNLIDLVLQSQEGQLRAEVRKPRDWNERDPLIMSDALKRGLKSLSSQRVQDTLLAESGPYHTALIDKFRDGKAEQTSETLQELFGASFKTDAKALEQLGFLEPIGVNWKIPMLYRAGLNITQGRAAPPGVTLAAESIGAGDEDGDEE